MKSFHNDIEVKNKYLARVRAHQAADRLVHGIGWDGEKGCAVGCTLEAYNHKAYEVELGIPEWLARIEDHLFEGMSKRKARTWPERFLEAIPLGIDLEQVKVPFIVVVLEHSLGRLSSLKVDAQFPDVISAIEGSKNSIKQMIAAQKSGDRERIQLAWLVSWGAEKAAISAANSAEAVVKSNSRFTLVSAYLAASSAMDTAMDAAWSASWSAQSASWWAQSALWPAFEPAKTHDYFADKLIEILKGCGGTE